MSFDLMHAGEFKNEPLCEKDLFPSFLFCVLQHSLGCHLLECPPSSHHTQVMSERQLNCSQFRNQSQLDVFHSCLIHMLLAIRNSAIGQW